MPTETTPSIRWGTHAGESIESVTYELDTGSGYEIVEPASVTALGASQRPMQGFHVTFPADTPPGTQLRITYTAVDNPLPSVPLESVLVVPEPGMTGLLAAVLLLSVLNQRRRRGEP